MEYRAFENALAEMHSVRPDELGALRSRLRLLRDAGIPAVAKPGKGERVSYSYDDLWFANFGLTLDQFGLPPLAVKEIVRTVTRSRDFLSDLKSQSQPSDLWLLLNVMKWGKDGSAVPYFVGFSIGTLVEIEKNLRAEETKKPGLPAVFQGLLDLSCLTRDCDQYFQP